MPRNAATPTSIAADKWRMLRPCRNNPRPLGAADVCIQYSVGSRRRSACDVHRKELRVHGLPAFPKLLPALNEHPEVLADQTPRRDAGGMGRAIACQCRLSVQAA